MLTIEHAENLFELRDYKHCLTILKRLIDEEKAHRLHNIGLYEEDCCKALEMKTYCLQSLGYYEEALLSVNEALDERNSLRMKMVKFNILSMIDKEEAEQVLIDLTEQFGYDHEVRDIIVEA